ncbi:MAG: AAA family ATPase [Bacteroidales bacterium]|nr:AAA family ATPase [Bacteroidales bacterium]
MATVERKQKRTLLTSMEDVIAKAKEHSLNPEFYQAAAASLKYISSTLELSKEEALLLSLFFEKSSSNRIWINNLADLVNTSTIRIISMMNVADELVKKGYIKSSHNKNDENWYAVPKSVIDCIRQNTKIVPKPTTNLSFDDFFERMGEILDEDDIKYWDLRDQLEALVDGNLHLPYCKMVKSYDLYMGDEILLHIFAHRLINEDDDIIGTHDWEDYMEGKRHVRKILKDLKKGESELITKKLFEPTTEDGVRDPNYYHLTDKAKDELFPGMDLVEKTAKNDKTLISHTTFAPKQLFYTPRVQSQIDRLGELLQPEKFTQVTERLSENGMRKGFACLFYGSPGTGKTETVNQLARLTGRDVMVVDVTQIKSCWVGESEQNIKGLFDRYRALVKKNEVAPILLFNEADAVLGIRQEGAQRAVDKMENSIQNIILQEMETLEGVMIATTNLTCNLDKAFERRFIYKIEFERPTLEAKTQIWKSMIPSLSDEFAVSLAKDYDLSGGQIENVSRKRTVEQILSGVEPSEEMIREYCRAETLNDSQRTRNRIGF